MLDKRGMVIWSNLFHIGILGIFFGHLFGMLTPHWMYAWFLPIAVKQQMAMVLGGVCGVLTLIGGAGLLWRRLTNQRVRATSTTPDIIIMSILLIQCLLGLSTIPFSAQYPDGSEMMKLVGWAQGIVTFRGGSSEMLSGVAFVFRVHLVLGMTISCCSRSPVWFTSGARRLNISPAATRWYVQDAEQNLQSSRVAA